MQGARSLRWCAACGEAVTSVHPMHMPPPPTHAQDGTNAMMHAALGGHLDCVLALIADPNGLTTTQSQTAVSTCVPWMRAPA